MATMTVKIHVAWWLTPYFYVLATMCAITGREPNYERVKYWIDKVIKVDRGPTWRRIWRKLAAIVRTAQ